MVKILDKYYKYPVFYDYLISIIIIFLLVILERKDIINIPEKKFSYEFASDIGAIGLTISGFILTLITILISFKSSQILGEEKLKNDSNTFKIFLASDLYKSSIKILQNGVISLIIISFVIFLTKLLYLDDISDYIFYLNIVGLVVILSTFLRCYYVLGLILKMQS